MGKEVAFLNLNNFSENNSRSGWLALNDMVIKYSSYIGLIEFPAVLGSFRATKAYIINHHSAAVQLLLYFRAWRDG